MMMGIGGPRASAAAAVAITSTDSKVDAVDRQTYTFTSCALGSAAGDRRIIVGIGARKSTATLSISSVTVGGVSASAVVTAVDSASDNIAALWIADVPSGTTGDVVVTFNEAGVQRCGIGVWRMVGASSGTASDTDSNTGVSTTPTIISKTLTIPTGGSAVGYSFTTGSALTATWTNLTESFDATVESGVFHTGASADIPAGGNTALQVEWSSTPTQPPPTVFAAWGP